jgi:methionyl-tRNA formyltransferase
MKIVFLGTPDFAVPSLKMLVKQGYIVAGVFTQPDRKRDRGQKLSAPPAKLAAIEHGIPVYQFERIKAPESVGALKDISPDLMVTAAFGQILSAEILAIPPLGCINVHASLLPKYRGAAPIEWTIINGETVTGITTMYTDIGLDTGDIILKHSVEIGEEETGSQLCERLSLLGADVLAKTLQLVINGQAPREKQNEHEMSYFPMLNKETGHINWRSNAKNICNLCRALDTSPGAYTMLNGEKIKIFKTRIIEMQRYHEEGEVLTSTPREGLLVQAGDGVLELLEIQMPGSRRMLAKEMLKGKIIPAGTVLGR